MKTKQPITSHQSPVTDDLQFLVNCCKTDLSDKDIESILSYLSQITNYDVIPEEQGQSLLALNADTPVVKTKVGCITAASQHGILPLVYKTIKYLSQNNDLNATR